VLWVCKRLLHLQPANGEAISGLQGSARKGGCSFKVVFLEGGKKEKFFFRKKLPERKTVVYLHPLRETPKGKEVGGQ